MEVFISHSHADAALAAEFEKFLGETTMLTVAVRRSSKAGEIDYGSNWVEWIHKRVQTAGFTFVLLTPSSFSAKWVLWEAGAVTGVQRAAGGLQDENGKQVIPIGYNVDRQEDLGPFEGVQITDGIDATAMEALAKQLISKLQDKKVMNDGQVSGVEKTLTETCQAHVQTVRGLLEQLQISQTQDVVQEWVERLEDALNDDDYAFVRSARRWINIAFLGPGRADDRETPVDFRLHLRLANGFVALQEWKEAKDQLTLARGLSPRDMMVLRKLGRVELELGDPTSARRICNEMRELDASILTDDEEALMLSVRIHIENGDQPSALEELKEASKLAHSSAYALNMLAILTLKIEGSDQAEVHFHALRELESKVEGDSIWTLGNLINAALGLGDEKAADALLGTIQKMDKANENRDSISRYFDEIISRRQGFSYDWKARWPDS